MSKKREKKGKAVPVGIGILVFILAFGAGVVSKLAIQPSWAKEYSVKWSDEIGTLRSDLPYGDGEANKFDLYLPKDSARESYGLVVYLHAGGFTSGDKTDDKDTLAWLCSKGYVATAKGPEAMDRLAKAINNGALDNYTWVIVTQDAHPTNHCSFVENGGVFPPHCVQGTEGMNVYPSLQFACKHIGVGSPPIPPNGHY